MNEIRTRLFQFFCVAIPFVFYGTRPERIVQEDYFKYLGMCLVAWFCGSVWIALFMALNVFLFIYHGEHVGLSQTLNIFIGICIFMVSKAFFKKNYFSIIKTPILIVTLINLVMMIFQAFYADPMFSSQAADGSSNFAPTQMVGFLGIKMAMGSYMTIASIILMSNPIASFALIVPIFMSQSSSVFMAFGAWVCFWVYFKKRRLFIPILIAGVIASLAYARFDYATDKKTFKSRIPVWHATIHKSLIYPLGYGPDSYRKTHKHKNFMFSGDGNYNHAIRTYTSPTTSEFQFYSPTNDIKKIEELTLEASKTGKLFNNEMTEWDNPHNGVLNIFFQCGVAGLVILIGLIREMALRFKSVMKDDELIMITGCIISLAICSLTNFPIELARVGYLFPVFMGAFYAKTRGLT